VVIQVDGLPRQEQASRPTHDFREDLEGLSIILMNNRALLSVYGEIMRVDQDNCRRPETRYVFERPCYSTWSQGHLQAFSLTRASFRKWSLVPAITKDCWKVCSFGNHHAEDAVGKEPR
jgi:hypothetical protein